MPFEIQGREALDAFIGLRLPEREKLQIQEEADLAGISMSELVRRRYFGRPIVADVDLQMIRELRRIGGLLKHVHNSSGGAYSSETANAVQEVRRFIEHLSRDR